MKAFRVHRVPARHAADRFSAREHSVPPHRARLPTLLPDARLTILGVIDLRPPHLTNPTLLAVTQYVTTM